jgi:hypothetical protein
MVLIENLLAAGISIPLQSDPQLRINTSYLHSRQLASYFTELNAYYEYSGEIGISETNQLKRGARGRDRIILSFLVGLAQEKSHILWLSLN